uniref:Uncharacterized protein n=1 Tax=Glossina pallidipes TaxID=7398 RepID=A0A1B0A5E8_GLOPL
MASLERSMTLALRIERLQVATAGRQLLKNNYMRMKRGFNKYPKNNYESTIQVSQGILQYEKTNKDSTAALQKPEDLLTHHEISIKKDWQPSTSIQADGHIVWSHPYTGDHNYGYDPDKTDVHILSQSPASLANYHHHHHAGSVFSNDLPAGNILESLKLHTNALRDSEVSKNIGRRKVNDNIDFNNAFRKQNTKGSYRWYCVTVKLKCYK